MSSSWKTRKTPYSTDRSGRTVISPNMTKALMHR